MKTNLWHSVILAVIAAIALTTMNVFVGLILLFPIVLSSNEFTFRLHQPFKFSLRTISTLLGSALLFMGFNEHL